jgi:hypothetical protein
VSETIAILDEQGFHLRVHDAWHHGLSRERSRRLLLAAGIDDHDAHILLDSAVWWPRPAEVQYKPTGRRHSTVGGRPVTKEGAAWEFRKVGMKYDDIRHLMRIDQLCYEIEQRLPPPPHDCMTIQEFGRLLVDELNCALSARVARDWAREHLRAARCKHTRKLDSWKKQFERDHPKRRITQDEFAQVLARLGIKTLGDDVYATDICS